MNLIPMVVQLVYRGLQRLDAQPTALKHLMANIVTNDKQINSTQALRVTAPSFQDGRQLPSWILSIRKPLPRMKHGVDWMHRLRDIRL